MTVETDECNGVCEGSKAEFEGKSVLELGSQGDLKKPGEYNGVSCGNGDAKDDTDGSYVFVNGETDEHAERDLDANGKVDRTVTPGIESSVGNNGTSPQNAGSEVEEKLVGDEESSSQKGEDGELVLENGHDHEESVVPNSKSEVEGQQSTDEMSVNDAVEGLLASELVVEVEENGEFREGKEESGELVLKDGYDHEESVVPNSNSEVEGHLGTEEMSVNDVEDQLVAELDVEMEENGELCEKEESEELVLEDGYNHEESVVPNSNSEVEGHKSTEDTSVNDAVVDQLEAVVNDAVEDRPVAESVVEMDNRELPEDMEESRELCMENDCVHGGINEETDANGKVEDQTESESAVAIIVTDTVGSEPLSLTNEEMGMPNVTDEIPAEKNFADLGLELESKSQTGIEMEVEDGSPESGERVPICTVDDVDSKAEASNDLVGSGESMHSCPAEALESESEAINGLITSPESACPVDDEGKEVPCFDDNVKLEPEFSNMSAESGTNISACPADDMNSETKVEEVSTEGDGFASSCPVHGTKLELEVKNFSVESQESVSACPEVETKLVESGKTAPACPDKDTGLVTEDINIAVETNKDAPTDHVDGVNLKSEVGGEPVEHGESTPDTIEENQSANKDVADKLVSTEDAIEGVLENGVLPSPPEDPGSSSLQGQKVDTDVKRLPCFMVRVPRFSDDKIKTQIQHAQHQLDEKTQSRDSIGAKMQKQKATCTEYWRKVEDARKEERAARDAVSDKRKEIDSIQPTLNKIKNASSIGDIDNRIHDLQHRLQHETIPLKEEKLLIREINQLKLNREHLSSNLASQEELQEAFEKQEQTENRLQHIKEELDSLRKEVLRTEGITKAARDKYDEQHKLFRDLQAQFQAADDLRQEAYRHLRILRKESFEKNKYFYMYKDYMKAATNYAFSGDREALQSHCTDQVEKVMELWNKNDEFRNQYVKANMVSTLRRFRTLDGRSLGPNEEPPVLRNTIEEKVNSSPLCFSKSSSALPVLALERKQEKLDAPVASEKMDSEHGPKVAQKNQSQKSKKSTKLNSREIVKVMVSSVEDEKEEREKDNKRTKEEEELARKAEELARKEEELKKEKATAALKEQRRLEQITKAKEAEERKRRKAEKDQAKADIRAQKEAELREKKRAKKEKKKEKKKAATTDSENVGKAEVVSVSDGTLPETVQEPENKANMVSKRSSRQAAAAKQYNKIKPLPLPLRNRGKRKMQTWMWVLLTAIIILALFLAGNYISFSKFSLPNFGF